MRIGEQDWVEILCPTGRVRGKEFRSYVGRRQRGGHICCYLPLKDSSDTAVKFLETNRADLKLLSREGRKNSQAHAGFDRAHPKGKMSVPSPHSYGFQGLGASLVTQPKAHSFFPVSNGKL